MKQLYIKIASFLLAFLLLFSTFSFTVEKHYCGDVLVNVSFTGQTECCAMNMDVITSIKKKNCCKKEIQKIEGQDQLQFNKIEKITGSKQLYVTAFLVSYNDLSNKNKPKNYFYKDFFTPDIWLDYQVLYQTFLI